MSQQQTSTAQPGGKTRLWMRALLIMSLSFNLLVLGVVVGAKWGGYRDHGFDVRGPNRGAICDLGFAPLAGALSRDDRRKIGKVLRDQSGSFSEHRKRLASEFNEMLMVLRAEPFEHDHLRQLMNQQSQRLSKRGQVLRDTLVERISQMTLEERRELAVRVERSVRKRRR